MICRSAEFAALQTVAVTDFLALCMAAKTHGIWQKLLHLRQLVYAALLAMIVRFALSKRWQLMMTSALGKAIGAHENLRVGTSGCFW